MKQYIIKVRCTNPAEDPRYYGPYRGMRSAKAAKKKIDTLLDRETYYSEERYDIYILVLEKTPR